MASSFETSTTKTPKKQKIRTVIRNAKEQEWANISVIPDKGELVYASDVNTLKIGDGITTYDNLPAISSGEQGTTDYVNLTNKPEINGVTLVGNVSLSDLGLANVASTGEYSDLINTPVLGTMAAENASDYIKTSSLSNVALSGSYDDLVNKPNFGTAAYANTTDFATAAQGDLANTAVQPTDLANVATTGNYNDLSNKPTIPAAQVNADWNASSGVAEILNKPNLANVAISGDYNDLTNTPVLGTAAFANTTDFATAAEGNLATTAVQPGDLANVAFTGSYDDLTNKPTIPTTVAQLSDASDYALVNSLANVATTGEYSDLLNTPVIPAAQVQTDWNATSGMGVLLNKPTLANVATTGDYNDLTNKPSITGYVAGTGIDINTSTNTISTTDPVLLNEGTGTNALGIKGTATGTNAIGIGGSSTGTRSIGIGGNASGGGAIAIGGAGSATNSGAIAIGRRANATADHAIQISSAESPSYSNSDANTVKIATGTGNYEVLSADGTIPEARLADTTNATQNQVLTLDSNLNAVWSNVETLPSQTGHSGAFLTTNGTDASWSNLANVAISGDYNDLTNKPYIPEGVVVDQTYDPTSTNAASGIAVAEALGTLSNVASTGEYDDLLNKPTIPAAQVNSDWNATSGVAEILNKPTLSNVALSGEYSDLLNTPNLANVATTGEYSDLLNTPSIPSPQVNSDWNATSGIAEILNKPSLSTVATTGEYSDLLNTPTLGTAAAANTTDFATAAEGNLATTAVQPGDLANVATTGEYSDLLNTPTIPAAQVNSDWNAASGVAQILNKPTLANIATTGEYSDLINAPVLANVATSGEYSDLLNTPTIPTVSDATIIITQGGIQKGSFTLNQASGDTIALDAGGGSSLPSQTGHSGEFLTTDGTDASWSALANVAKTGEYSDLLNTPTNLSDFNDNTNLSTVVFRTWGVND